MKHILILSVSAGAGHMRAAQALQAACENSPVPCRATVVDLMDYAPAAFKRIYVDAYLKVVEKAPAFWSYLYKASNAAERDAAGNRLRRALERFSNRKLMGAIESLKPDAIVCTHFMPAELLSREIEQKRLSVPVHVQITDFDLHSLWVQPHMATHFATNEEVELRLLRAGTDPSKIMLTGIPVMPCFSQKYDRSACAKEFGMDPGKTTLLLMSGGAGLAGAEETAEQLLSIPGSQFQIAALAGKNEKLLAGLRALAAKHPGRLFPFGFTRVIERLMACSDLAISKPGGLTSSECMAMGLPMIAVNPIPGQEERNADYLCDLGGAMKASDPIAMEARIASLANNPEKLASMRSAMLAGARPGAAAAAVARVLASC